MAHKTLIGGTAYKINGGKTLVNGAIYDMYYGKTHIDGTNYDIEFGKRAKVKLSKGPYSANANYASVTINGIVYDGSTDTTIKVRKGTVVECFATGGGSGLLSGTGYIFINGKQVKGGDNSSYATTINDDASIYVGKHNYSGYIKIAEKGYILFSIVILGGYCAQEGMTWSEWINSDLNTVSALTISIKDDGLVYLSKDSAEQILKYNSVAVKGSDVIVADGWYSSV